MTTQPHPGLPVASTLRWQPLRLGLVDLFFYEDEEFPFRDGRLLLRGNNGAGKSKVLALTLPFLLDGDTSARRIEPDADPAKRMEWNLLLGGEYPHSERIGYTWLEFGRRDEDGVEHFLTIGAGLKAATGRGLTKTWFFITSQRIRDELSLIDSGRLALGRERLAEAIGDAGHVYDTKRDYRLAIDERLFGLGERRYDALIDLLLQIRAPQLSKRPSERLLSDALTESLTPIPRNLIASVAEGLRGLDEDREELQQLTDARRSVMAFLAHYSGYARALAKRQSRPPREAQAEYDRLGRLIIEIGAETTTAADLHATAVAERDSLIEQQSAREAESEALRDSEYAEIEAHLKSADDAARRAKDRLDHAESEGARAEKALTLAQRNVDEEHGRVQAARSIHEGSLTEVATHALDAGFEQHAHTTHLDSSGEDSRSPAERLATDRAETNDRIRSAREAISRVHVLLTAVETAAGHLNSAKQHQDGTDSRLAQAVTDAADVDATASNEALLYVQKTEGYLASLAELAIPDEDFTAFTDWVQNGAGENPIRLALLEAAHRANSTLTEIRAALRVELATLRAEHHALNERIRALQSGEIVRPPAANSRPSRDSTGLAFWRAVNFREDVPDVDRAGLEAALEASGLLTALLQPAGELRAPSGELVFQPQGTVIGGSTLRDLLQVELPATSNLDSSVVDDVLGALSLQQGTEVSSDVWVSVTGDYRIGAARGAWSKPAAQYIGESARADARAHELEAALTEQTALRSTIGSLDAESSALDTRLATVKAEQSALPAPTDLDEARQRAILAADRVASAGTASEQASDGVRSALTSLTERRDELAFDAQALGLPTDPELIEQRSVAIERYATSAVASWHAIEILTGARRVLAETEDRLTERLDSAGRSRAEQQTATEESIARRAAASALLGRVGEDVAHYRKRVSSVAAALETLKKALPGAHNAVTKANTAEALLSERLRGARNRLEQVAATRVVSVAALRKTAALGLVRVAVLELEQPDPDTEWSVTQGVQLARAIDAALADTDSTDVRFDRLLAQVHTEYSALQQSLARHGHQTQSYPREEGYQVLVVFAGRQASLPELAEWLTTDIAARHALLGAREREIIENHLVTEVGAHLSELVGDADRQIADVNSELASRPTSTGMKLRVRWKQRADGPSGLAEARARLSKIADVWDESDRKALGEFLQARIEEVRESDETGNWYDHLDDALDYRRWHHFVVERHQGGAWKPATGPASGGERVLAASIPLFAAASSHYRTATNPYAPRLVMLDEAFAGVDDYARASCLGLLAAFDLDVVMTSEREWGCYAEVPGLSIAQLSRFQDTPAVLVQLWSWDGNQRNRVGVTEVDTNNESTIW